MQAGQWLVNAAVHHGRHAVSEPGRKTVAKHLLLLRLSHAALRVQTQAGTVLEGQWRVSRLISTKAQLPDMHSFS